MMWKGELVVELKENVEKEWAIKSAKVLITSTQTGRA